MNTTSIPAHSSFDENLIDLDSIDVGFFLPYQGGYITFTFLACIAGLAFFFVLYVARKSRNFDAKKRLHLTGIFLFCVGAVLLSVFNKRIQKSIPFEYRGLMRIKGYHIDVRYNTYCRTTCGGGRRRLNACSPCPCNTKCDSTNKHKWLAKSSSSGSSGSSSCKKETRKCTTTRDYDVHLDVEWGMKWGCPRTPATLCESTVVFSPCKDKNSWDDARNCMKSVYDPGKPTVDYDTQSPPSLDVQWPSVILYGDCNTCTAKYSVPDSNRLRRVKISGAVLSTLGAFLVAMPLLMSHVIPQMAKAIRKLLDSFQSLCNSADAQKKSKKSTGGNTCFGKCDPPQSSLFGKKISGKKSKKMESWEKEVTMSVSEKSEYSARGDAKGEVSFANDMEPADASSRQ